MVKDCPLDLNPNTTYPRESVASVESDVLSEEEPEGGPMDAGDSQKAVSQEAITKERSKGGSTAMPPRAKDQGQNRAANVISAIKSLMTVCGDFIQPIVVVVGWDLLDQTQSFHGANERVNTKHCTRNCFSQ